LKPAHPLVKYQGFPQRKSSNHREIQTDADQ
jgi:hypothetical protein